MVSHSFFTVFFFLKKAGWLCGCARASVQWPALAREARHARGSLNPALAAHMSGGGGGGGGGGAGGGYSTELIRRQLIGKSWYERA
jgi:hypothetical protein